MIVLRGLYIQKPGDSWGWGLNWIVWCSWAAAVPHWKPGPQVAEKKTERKLRDVGRFSETETEVEIAFEAIKKRTVVLSSNQLDSPQIFTNFISAIARYG